MSHGELLENAAAAARAAAATGPDGKVASPQEVELEPRSLEDVSSMTDKVFPPAEASEGSEQSTSANCADECSEVATNATNGKTSKSRRSTRNAKPARDKARRGMWPQVLTSTALPGLSEGDEEAVKCAAHVAVRQLGDLDEPLLLIDLDQVSRKLAEWQRFLPNVVPHYTVSCNPDKRLLQQLHRGCCRFDCSTMDEIRQVLSMGVPPDDIMFSHPCKVRSHLKYASRKNVQLMAFDNAMELQKVAMEHPSAKLLLRLECNDEHAQRCAPMKFGAASEEWEPLLQRARDLNLDVVGVTFQACLDKTDNLPEFEQALGKAREVFELAANMGYQFKTVDIGGGFPAISDPEVTFATLAAKITEHLASYFPGHLFPGLQVVAEPGRFLSCSSASLLTKVFAKALPCSPDSQHSTVRYYLNDGLYGAFNCILYDKVGVGPPLSLRNTDKELRHCHLFGPTCDPLDVILKDQVLPELEEGDWLLWRNMGAYTNAAGSNLSGTTRARVWHYNSSTLPADL